MKVSFLRQCWQFIRVGLWLMHTMFVVWKSPPRNYHIMGERSKKLLDMLNIKLVNTGEQTTILTPSVIVANHISWLDVFVLYALNPCGFIAKKSIRLWPVIGRIADRAGTVFINRKSRDDVPAIVKGMSEALREGRCSAFFPESRCSDGYQILPFKAALFQAAVDTQLPIQSVAIRYLRTNGTPCDAAAYFGKVTLLGSVWRVAGEKEIITQIAIAAPFTSHDRYLAKDLAEEFVQQHANHNATQ